MKRLIILSFIFASCLMMNPESLFAKTKYYFLSEDEYQKINESDFSFIDRKNSYPFVYEFEGVLKKSKNGGFDMEVKALKLERYSARDASGYYKTITNVKYIKRVALLHFSKFDVKNRIFVYDGEQQYELGEPSRLTYDNGKLIEARHYSKISGKQYLKYPISVGDTILSTNQLSQPAWDLRENILNRDVYKSRIAAYLSPKEGNAYNHAQRNDFMNTDKYSEIVVGVVKSVTPNIVIDWYNLDNFESLDKSLCYTLSYMCDNEKDYVLYLDGQQVFNGVFVKGIDKNYAPEMKCKTILNIRNGKKISHNLQYYNEKDQLINIPLYIGGNLFRSNLSIPSISGEPIVLCPQAETRGFGILKEINNELAAVVEWYDSIGTRIETNMYSNLLTQTYEGNQDVYTRDGNSRMRLNYNKEHRINSWSGINENNTFDWYLECQTKTKQFVFVEYYEDGKEKMRKVFDLDGNVLSTNYYGRDGYAIDKEDVTEPLSDITPTNIYYHNIRYQIPDSVFAAMKAEEANDVSITSENMVFTVVDQQPEFPGGEAGLMQHIKNSLKYPAEAAANGVQGRVTLTFVVEKDGSIAHIEIMRSPAEELSKEAIRVVQSMPKWKPGKLSGKPVRVKYVLPITFRLQ